MGKSPLPSRQSQIPPDAVPEDEEERERSEWWKAKKWAYGILGRLFHRFGNPSQLPSSMQKEYKAFAEHFITAFTPEIFKIYLHQIELYISGTAWLSKKCQYQILTFMNEWCASSSCDLTFCTYETAQHQAQVYLGATQASLRHFG